MRRHLRSQFWFSSATATLGALSLALTLLWHDWIEVAFGVDPDQRSGTLEWLIVVVFALVTITSLAVSAGEWRGATASAGGRA